MSTTISEALRKLSTCRQEAWGKRVDRRSDVYSLGAVLYEMLTGAPLFEGDTDMSVLERVREGDVEPPSAHGVEVSKRVDQIVLKALAKNPQERYQNASEMEKDLHAVLYAFQPSPGPADVAIYLHRLLEASESSPTGDEIDRAFDAARDSEPAPAPAPVLPKRGRGLLIQQTGEMHLPPASPAAAPRESAPLPRRETPRAPVEAAASIPAAGESKRAAPASSRASARRRRARGRRPLHDEGPLDGARRASFAPAEVGVRARARDGRPAPAPAAEGPKVVDSKAVEAEARRLAAERERRPRTPPPGSRRRETRRAPRT